MRKALLLIVVGLVGGTACVVLLRHWQHALFGLPETESAFRHRIENCGAEQILVKRAQDAFNGTQLHCRLDQDFRPDEVKVLHSVNIEGYLPMGSPSNPTGITFIWGGADAHYGIIVMRDGVTPDPDWSYIHPWQRNVWYFRQTHRP